jgi:hypothetical protein
MLDDIRATIDAAPEFQPTSPAKGDDDDGSKITQRDLVVMVGLKSQLWHDSDGVTHATTTVGDHLENFPLRSTAFKRWLLAEFGRTFPKTLPGGQTVPGGPSNAALSEGLNALDAAACAGPERKPALRVCEHNRNIHLDLGRADWSAVEVTPTGWRVIPVPPIPFGKSGADGADGNLPLPSIFTLSTHDLVALAGEDWP